MVCRIVGAVHALSAYNFKLMCKNTGQQGTDKIDYFKPLYARGHDRAYTVGHPINFITNPALLFNDYLKVGSGSMVNVADFLKSAEGAPYYKQFARVYPVLHFSSNRKITYDPVGYRAATTVSPVGLTGPYAFAARTSVEFASPTVQVEYKEAMSDKSCLLDCCMYENTDFAVRMARYGYTYSCPNNDLFIVTSYSRGVLVLRVVPTGGDILHIEGRSVNEDSAASAKSADLREGTNENPVTARQAAVITETAFDLKFIISTPFKNFPCINIVTYCT